MTDCPNPELLHLDHGVGKDSTTGLLNTVVDRLESLSTQLNKLTELVESYSKKLEELTLAQSEFEEFFLEGRSTLGFVPSLKYSSEYSRLAERRRQRQLKKTP